jgi:hypothetical protein
MSFRWEYCYVESDTTPAFVESDRARTTIIFGDTKKRLSMNGGLIEHVNRLGSEGWEAVGFAGTSCLMKRSKV